MQRAAKNLIVFDWNGTILADTSACLRAANTVLGHLGVPQATIAQYRNHYTMPLQNLYHALGVDHDVLEAKHHEITPMFHSAYGSAAIRLRRGAKAMLQNIMLTSGQSIILSNYVTTPIEMQAQKLGVRQYFSDVIAFEVGDATFKRVGKGDRLKNYLADRTIKSGIIIGDSEEEVVIGRELGFVTVAITDGMCSTARLRAQKPDYLIRSLAEIPAIAKHVFGENLQAAQ